MAGSAGRPPRSVWPDKTSPEDSVGHCRRPHLAERIFLTEFDDKQATSLCIDRHTGKESLSKANVAPGQTKGFTDQPAGDTRHAERTGLPGLTGCVLTERKSEVGTRLPALENPWCGSS